MPTPTTAIRRGERLLGNLPLTGYQVGDQVMFTAWGWQVRLIDVGHRAVVLAVGPTRLKLRQDSGEPGRVLYAYPSTTALICACTDHWHCTPTLAGHDCTGPDRTQACPTCGTPPGDTG